MGMHNEQGHRPEVPIGHDREIGSANAQRDRPSRGRSVILPAVEDTRCRAAGLHITGAR